MPGEEKVWLKEYASGNRSPQPTSLNPANERSFSGNATTSTGLEGSSYGNGPDLSVDSSKDREFCEESMGLGAVKVKINGTSGQIEERHGTWRRGSIECRHVKLPLLDAQHRENGGEHEGEAEQTTQLFVEPAPADEVLWTH